MPTTSDQRGPQYHRVHIGVKYGTLHFPLDPRELAYLLPERGWVVPSAIAELPSGGRMGGVGLLARKGSSQLRWNTDGQVLSVAGKQPEKVVEDFKDVEAMITEDIDYDSNANAEYYELVAEALVPSRSSPLLQMQGLGQSVGLPAILEGAAGRRLALYGLRFSPENGNPGDIEWYDLIIAPLTVRADKYYSVELVWRSKIREQVFDATLGLTEHLARVLTALEEHHE